MSVEYVEESTPTGAGTRVVHRPKETPTDEQIVAEVLKHSGVSVKVMSPEEVQAAGGEPLEGDEFAVVATQNGLPYYWVSTREDLYLFSRHIVSLERTKGATP